ncbi:MAG: helix-turn-helix transcriptional regulator [Planctomycetota bacterium]
MPESNLDEKEGSIPDREHDRGESVSPTPDQTIGQYVRHRRKAAGMTQRALGELAGVGARFVSELERDKPTVRVDAVNRVLAVFGKRLGPVDAPRKSEA